MTSVIEDRTIRTVLTSVWIEGARRSIVVTLVEVASEVEAQNRPVRLLQYLAHEMRSSLLMMEGSLRSLGDTAPVAFLAQEAARLVRLLDDASKFHRDLARAAGHGEGADRHRGRDQGQPLGHHRARRPPGDRRDLPGPE